MQDAYSFSDASAVFSHDSMGTLTMVGTGVVNVTVAMTGDRTTMDVAADGTVMTSKIRDRRGSVAIQLQQNSKANLTLLKWYNSLEDADSTQWDKITAVIKSPKNGEVYTCKRGAFQKLPEKSYAAQGQTMTWNFLFADVAQATE